MEKLRVVLNNLYSGCEFIRKSKYGRVKGVAESIIVSDSFIFDEDSENKFKYMIDHSVKGSKTMEEPKLTGEEPYTASQPKFHVRSTNGIIYDFNECYFINEEKSEIWLEQK